MTVEEIIATIRTLTDEDDIRKVENAVYAALDRIQRDRNTYRPGD